MITPCGIVPRTIERVDQLVDAAAEFVAAFEERRFRLVMDQVFYELDEVPAKQLLYISLSTIVHIWNRSLASRLDIKVGESPKNDKIDFLITHSKDKDSGLMTKNQVGVDCGLTRQNGRNGRNGIERNTNKKQADFPVLRYRDEQIRENPFNVAHDIIQSLTGEDWRAYLSVHNNTLTCSWAKQAGRED